MLLDIGNIEVSKGPTIFFNTATLSTLKPSGIQGRGVSNLEARALFPGFGGGAGIFPPHLQSQGKAPWGRGWGVNAIPGGFF